MKRKGLFKGIFIGLILGIFISIIFSLFLSALKFNYEQKRVNEHKKEIEYSEQISEVIHKIDRHFIGEKEINKEILYNFAMQGIVNSLNDKYSEFLPYKNFEEKVDDLNGTYVGLGFEASKKNNKYLEILTVYLDSPAYKAGLLANDIILEIDDIDIKSKESNETIAMIRGVKGSSVKLKIKRGGKIFTVRAKRDEIKSKIVDYKMLDNNIGYIYISQFSVNVAKDFTNALRELKKQGMKKLILDLRNNGGGEIDEIIDIASLVLPDNIKNLFSIHYKTLEDITHKKSVSQEFLGDIIVLANNKTASAAEMLIAILKDYDRAKILGEKTFGKGIIQTFFYLKTGDVLKLTVGEYLSPKGNRINKVGINPDYSIAMNEYISKTGYINESEKEEKKRKEIIKEILKNQYNMTENNIQKIINNGDIQLVKAIDILNKK